MTASTKTFMVFRLAILSCLVLGQGGCDTDGDGIPDASDNCPATPNPNQADADADGFGDVCDECPEDPDKIDPGTCGCGTADVDTDGDCVADCIDNCPEEANPDQADTDGDGIGDACDDSAGDEYTLTLAIVGEGSVTVTPPGVTYSGEDTPVTETYTSATVVTLSAVADPDWSFYRWWGDLSDSTNPTTLLVDGVKDVVAVFLPEGLAESMARAGPDPEPPDENARWKGFVVAQSVEDSFYEDYCELVNPLLSCGSPYTHYVMFSWNKYSWASVGISASEPVDSYASPMTIAGKAAWSANAHDIWRQDYHTPQFCCDDDPPRPSEVGSLRLDEVVDESEDACTFTQLNIGGFDFMFSPHPDLTDNEDRTFPISITVSILPINECPFAGTETDHFLTQAVCEHDPVVMSMDETEVRDSGIGGPQHLQLWEFEGTYRQTQSGRDMIIGSTSTSEELLLPVTDACGEGDEESRQRDTNCFVVLMRYPDS